MGNLKTKVILLALAHQAEDFRKLTFAPLDKDGNVDQKATPLSIIAKGAKNEKDNFAEGEVYNLSITKDEAPAPPAGDKNKTNTGKGQGKDDKKDKTPTPPAPPTGEGTGDAGTGEGQDPPAQTGSGEGQ